MLDRLYAGKVPVAVAAGAGDDSGELGTDATAIMAAVAELDAPNGVLVLLDLGSAVLSAELALELLDDETRNRVALCAAPLVEGAVAAAAQCSIGASLAEVQAEAEQALSQKQQHLAPAAVSSPGRQPAPPSLLPAGGATATLDLRVDNPHGLHARPAMRIVQAMARFRSQVQIENLRTGASSASARSLVSINCLDARAGDTIRASASGEDAAAALAALAALHAEHFGDAMEDAAAVPPVAGVPPPAPPAHDDRAGVLRGQSLSDGIGIGRLVFASRTAVVLPAPTSPVDAAAEAARLDAALTAVRHQLGQQAAALASRVGGEHAAILEAHQALSEDPTLVAGSEALIRNEGLPAAHAWQRTVAAAAAAYRALPDALLRERAGDVEDLGLQVLQALGVASSLQIDLAGEEVLLVVPTLLPSELATLDLRRVRGVIAETIGQTSHAAILLRAAGVPVVEGITAQRLRESGNVHGPAAMDGASGEIWLAPDEQTYAALRQRLAVLHTSQETGDQTPPALCTREGRRIELAANVGGLADAVAARKYRAEAIGLLRTEFLFLDRSERPGEQEQLETLLAVSNGFARELPLTVRTLDIGGDKPVPYLPTVPESNPFLGVRGLRLTLRHEELFLTHLRAILRAAHERRFRIMFPMVTEVAEIRAARLLLTKAHEQLAWDHLPHAWPIETGMMVEVPAAALNAFLFAPEVDFFSIGTNDLTQYTLAAERGHPLLTNLADALHPGVLRLIAKVAGAAKRRGIWAGVCGEAAADPVAAAVFVGLGITELSVGVGALSKTRRLVGDLDYPKARAFARRCLRMASVDEMRHLCNTAQVLSSGSGNSEPSILPRA